MTAPAFTVIADREGHRAYLEAEARALLDYIGRLPLDHMDRWILSRRYNEITRELRALEKHHENHA